MKRCFQEENMKKKKNDNNKNSMIENERKDNTGFASPDLTQIVMLSFYLLLPFLSDIHYTYVSTVS